MPEYWIVDLDARLVERWQALASKGTEVEISEEMTFNATEWRPIAMT